VHDVHRAGTGYLNTGTLVGWWRPPKQRQTSLPGDHAFAPPPITCSRANDMQTGT
jgi:hypothetical protein